VFGTCEYLAATALAGTGVIAHETDRRHIAAGDIEQPFADLGLHDHVIDDEGRHVDSI
jgi:hypothetical protein